MVKCQAHSQISFKKKRWTCVHVDWVGLFTSALRALLATTNSTSAMNAVRVRSMITDKSLAPSIQPSTMINGSSWKDLSSSWSRWHMSHTTSSILFSSSSRPLLTTFQTTNKTSPSWKTMNSYRNWMLLLLRRSMKTSWDWLRPTNWQYSLRWILDMKRHWGK